MACSKLPALFCAFFFAGAGLAQAAKVDVLPGEDIGYGTDRIALVIGNADYEEIIDLDNTLNDANAVSGSLQKVGFKVFRAQNVTRREMNDAIDKFLEAVTPGSEALVYYAGHGIEMGGENYLLPVDIRSLKPSQQRRLREDSVSLNRLLEDLRQRGARVNLVLLDACRDNPFPRDATRSLGGATGLGRIDPPQGTFVVYAAAAGEKALDKLSTEDTVENGLFTRHLLDLIARPGLEIRPLVQELKERVYADAQSTALHIQRPSYYDGLIGKFYFSPQNETVELKHPCEVLVDPRADKETVLRNDYGSSIQLCRRAVAAHPEKPIFQGLLRAAEEQLAAQKALTSTDAETAKAYVRQYGSGRYRRDVEIHVASLDPTQVLPQADAAADQVKVGSRTAGHDQVASIDPTAAAPAAAVASLSSRELAREIQSQLNRLGCSAGQADGIWGKRSRAALNRYVKHGDKTLASIEPSTELLKDLLGESARVCPLVCSVRETLQGGRCVAKTCAAGQRLSSKGQCYTPRKKQVAQCGRGQRRNSKGVCYTPKRSTAATQSAPKQRWQKPAKREYNRRPRGVTGYNFNCHGAGPGLC